MEIYATMMCEILGLAVGVASTIALFPILFKDDGARQTTERKPVPINNFGPPCLCDECNNAAAPSTKVDNSASLLFNGDRNGLLDLQTLPAPEEVNQFEAMNIHFPKDVLMEILSRLPVRSLLRFRCVSKFWKILISDPYFKTKHAKNYQNSEKFLIGRRCPKGKLTGPMLYYCSSLSSVQVVSYQEKLGYPDYRPHCRILCCCDGLSLLWYKGEHLLLWNPSTRESAVLPYQEFPPMSDYVYGMEYESVTDDYKIVKIDIESRYRPGSPGKILSLKHGLWRDIDECPCGFRSSVSVMDSLTFVHEAFHWIGINEQRSFFNMDDISDKFTVISFSISTEVYRTIPLPGGICNIFDTFWIQHGVSVLGGLLCAYCYYRDTVLGPGTFVLWMMKDYGVKESWSQLFTIQESNLYIVIPKYRFPDGEILLYYKDYSGYYGFRTCKEPFDKLSGSRTSQQGFVFTESLISPKLLI